MSDVIDRTDQAWQWATPNKFYDGDRLVEHKRVPISGGAPCPECERDRRERHPDRPVVLMQRYRHPDSFVPPPFAPWCQAQWDVCSCGHIAHHKHLRRPTPNYRPQPPYLARNKEAK